MNTEVYNVVMVHRGKQGDRNWCKIAVIDDNREPIFEGDYQRFGEPYGQIACPYEVFDEMRGIAGSLPCRCEFEVGSQLSGGMVKVTIKKFVRPVSGPDMKPKSNQKIAAE